jgi:hypothetical protein
MRTSKKAIAVGDLVVRTDGGKRGYDGIVKEINGETALVEWTHFPSKIGKRKSWESWVELKRIRVCDGSPH